MHYVKQFKINGVDTKQVACIELHGKPNAATEGAVGVLGIDVDSPLHDVYKCVAVNGSIYHWDLLSSGLSIMSATVSGGGTESMSFDYDDLRTPTHYVIKVGDLILDREGYLYQINAIGADHCDATYCGTQVVAYGKSAYDLAVKNGFEGSEEDWIASLKGEKGDQGDPATTYPVGFLYLRHSILLSPERVGLPGTWERIPDGHTIVGAGGKYVSGVVGGSETVTLTSSQLPKHSHSVTVNGEGLPAYHSDYVEVNGGLDSAIAVTANTIRTDTAVSLECYGKFEANDSITDDSTESRGAAHDNMPPYIPYYAWVRIA